MLEAVDIPYKTSPSPSLVGGGQPDRSQFERAAQAGIAHVINLRPVAEQGEDEAPLVESLGMRYHHLPVAGPQDISRETVAQLDAVLREIGEAPTLFHCATGNRVGALLALHAAWHEGRSAEEALDYGRRSGLTKLEPLVARLLDAEA